MSTLWPRRLRRLAAGALASAALALAALAGFAWAATHLRPGHHWTTPERRHLDAEEVHYGSTFAWRLRGRGPDTVFLFHGYGGSAANVLDEAAWFQARGFTAICVDFPNSGGSEHTATTLGWREADTVRAAVEGEAPRGRVLLFGQSMGSAAILRAVGAEGLHADALVLENPYDNLVRTVGNRFEKFSLPRWPGAELLVLFGGWEVGFDGFALNPAEYARGVTAPTLLLAGDADERVRPEDTRRVGGALAGPHTVELFPHAGHVAMRDADGKRWSRVVTAFLVEQGLLPGGGG